MTFIITSLSVVAFIILFPFTISISNATFNATSFEETIDVITSIGGEPVPFIYSFNITSGVDTNDFNSTLNLTMLFIGDECVNPSMSLDYLMVDYDASSEYLVIKGAGLTQKCGGQDRDSELCYEFAPCISDYQLPAIDGPLEFSIIKSKAVDAWCPESVESISVRLWITISCDFQFATNDATSTDQFTSQTIDVFANDFYADSFEFFSLTSPETGFVINYGNGTITYVPGPEAQERCEDIAEDEDSFNVTFDYEVATNFGNVSYYDIGAVIIEVSCIDIADIKCIDTIKVVCVAVESASDFASDSYESASTSDSRVYNKKKRKYKSSDESSDEMVIFKAVNAAEVEEAKVFGGNPQTSTNKEVISVRIAAADNMWVQFGLMIAVFFVCVCAVIVLNKNIHINNNNNNKV